MSGIAEELKTLTPQGFEALSQEKRQELIEYNDEFVREWRGMCQFCGLKLRGTRRSLREHKCEHAI